MVQSAIEDTVAVVEDNAPVHEAAPLEVTSPETQVIEQSPEPELLTAPETVKPDYSSLLADAPEDELLQTPKMRDILARREESIRRRTEEALKREASNNESVQAVLSNMLERAVDSGDPAEYRRVAGQALLWNRQYQMAELARELPDALLRSYKLPVEAREKALEVRESDPAKPNWDGYVTTLIDAAVETKVAEARREDEARVKKAIADGVIAELRARQVEAGPRLETPPLAPQGTVSTGGAIATMTDADRAFNEDRISFADYKKFREQFGLSAAPGGR